MTQQAQQAAAAVPASARMRRSRARPTSALPPAPPPFRQRAQRPGPGPPAAQRLLRWQGARGLPAGAGTGGQGLGRRHARGTRSHGQPADGEPPWQTLRRTASSPADSLADEGRCVCQTSSQNNGPQVTNYEAALRGASWAVNGPTTEQGLPPFAWGPFPNAPHRGQPERFAFEWQAMEP